MTNNDPTQPSPEVKALLREFVNKQREKYGDDWKEKLSAEMAEESMPFIRWLSQTAARAAWKRSRGE